MTPGAVLAVALWGLLTGATFCGLVRCWLDNRDRDRHIAACRSRESQLGRLEAGAARAEAWALQLDELRSLPTGKPRAW